MIHAICDFCGKDAGRSAFLLTLTPFQNFARCHGDSEPYGSSGPKKSYCLCQECHGRLGLPNPYHDYLKIQDQDQSYAETFGTYTEDDFKEDARRKRAQERPAMGWMQPQAPAGRGVQEGGADGKQ